MRRRLAACMKTPVGDPEQGWADPRISGAWLGEDEGGAPGLFVFDPFDRRTWLVRVTELRQAWLTTLGGKRFLVLEEREGLVRKDGPSHEPWFVFRAQLREGQLILRMTKDEEGPYATRSRAVAERIIARHAVDEAFYGPPMTPSAIPKAARAAANALLPGAKASSPAPWRAPARSGAGARLDGARPAGLLLGRLLRRRRLRPWPAVGRNRRCLPAAPAADRPAHLRGLGAQRHPLPGRQPGAAPAPGAGPRRTGRGVAPGSPGTALRGLGGAGGAAGARAG